MRHSLSESVNDHSTQRRGDLLTSTMFAVPPRFNFLPPPPSLHSSPIYINMPVLDLAESGSPQGILSTINRQLRYLTTQMPQARATKLPISKNDILAFSTARSLVEHSLLSLSAATVYACRDTDGCTDTCADPAPSFEAHRLAALIYINTILRNCSPNGALLISLKSQLVNAIQKAEGKVPYLWSQPRTTLWIYCIGGLLSLNDVEEIWFATRMAKALIGVGIQKWEEVEEALKRVV